MPGYAIIVEYEIKEGRRAEVEALIRDHAGRTLAEEPGCLRFEVLQPLDRDGQPAANRLMVSELYADAEALAAHRNCPRLPALREAFAPLLEKSRLTVTTVI